MDEPTVGLHYEDVSRLIEILNRLVDRGIPHFLIEHNLDIIKCSDYIIDIGPDGGLQAVLSSQKAPRNKSLMSKKVTPGSYLGGYCDLLGLYG